MELLGISRYIKHLKYEKNKGAHFYVSKYLDRDVDYDYIWKIKNLKLWKNYY